MAKARVLEDKVVITSDVLTNENIERVSILKPSVLILKDEETNEVLFEIGSDEETSITGYGCVFYNGKASGTLENIPTESEEANAKVRAIITNTLLKVNAVEEQVKAYLEEAENFNVDIEILG